MNNLASYRCTYIHMMDLDEIIERMSMNDMKRCSKCKEMKHEDDFREGSSVCKLCKRRADLKSIGGSDIGVIELSNIVREMAIQMKKM